MEFTQNLGLTLPDVKGTGFATAIAALDLPPPACYVIAKAA